MFREYSRLQLIRVDEPWDVLWYQTDPEPEKQSHASASIRADVINLSVFTKDVLTLSNIRPTWFKFLFLCGLCCWKPSQTLPQCCSAPVCPKPELQPPHVTKTQTVGSGYAGRKWSLVRTGSSFFCFSSWIKGDLIISYCCWIVIMSVTRCSLSQSHLHLSISWAQDAHWSDSRRLL